MTQKRHQVIAATGKQLILPLLIVFSLAIAACSAAPSEDIPEPTDTPATDEPLADTMEGEPQPTPEITIEEMNAFWADDDPYLGPEDAPVVIVEFSDYVCPYCGYFSLEILPQILDAYPEEVRFVHRDFPILAEESVATSLAAACALEQDLFWELHAQFFSAHADFDPEADVERDEAFFNALIAKFSEVEISRYVDEAGLDRDAYDTCIENGVGREEIVFDIQVGSQLGSESVPFYIINGYVYNGLLPFEAWQEIIDAALEARGE